MATPLNKEFDFEIANTYSVLQEKTIISFIGVIIIQLTKPKFIYFSGKRQLSEPI